MGAKKAVGDAFVSAEAQAQANKAGELAGMEANCPLGVKSHELQTTTSGSETL